eukprot:CAMPEP_0194479140 /NCGR_PEP_ID=MMETSP0253-20130528/2359_1 /TAXON_ID=2966 /ORGANISM="Noctiluca scintillans" /LENGTH=38 /DNA_ID= /DNA_START= /DNA_END= /DNA_ORIENTATION=
MGGRNCLKTTELPTLGGVHFHVLPSCDDVTHAIMNQQR